MHLRRGMEQLKVLYCCENRVTIFVFPKKNFAFQSHVIIIFSNKGQLVHFCHKFQEKPCFVNFRKHLPKMCKNYFCNFVRKCEWFWEHYCEYEKTNPPTPPFSYDDYDLLCLQVPSWSRFRYLSTFIWFLFPDDCRCSILWYYSSLLCICFLTRVPGWDVFVRGDENSCENEINVLNLSLATYSYTFLFYGVFYSA